ncbi:hypothetical protein F652_404 [Enterobacteriaceae bacterium bta3-1]|nr:hypothetical protein F652_404 [Enterobacteriaceae bacterium bta3-1]
MQRLFCHLTFYGGYDFWITVPYIENTESTQAIDILVPLSVDKRVKATRLPFYGSVIPACRNRFPIFKETRINVLLKIA